MLNKKIKNKKMILGWLRKAEDDLAFAESAFAETEFYDHICFLSQQAVEKYLKLVIIISKGKLAKKEKTHNLIYLSNLCQKDGLNLSKFEKNLRELSEAYIPARYPVDIYIKFNRQEAEQCLKNAQKIIDFIKDKIDFSVYYSE